MEGGISHLTLAPTPHMEAPTPNSQAPKHQICKFAS